MELLGNYSVLYRNHQYVIFFEYPTNGKFLIRTNPSSYTIILSLNPGEKFPSPNFYSYELPLSPASGKIVVLFEQLQAIGSDPINTLNKPKILIDISG